MNILIDAILVLIFGWSIFSYMKNGFIKSLIDAGTFFVSFALACLLASPIGTAISNGEMYEGISSAVGNNIGSVSEGVIESTSLIACKVIAFISVFILTFVIISIVSVILQRILEIPLLREIDKIAGLVLGIVVGLLKAFVISSFIEMILNFGIVKNGAEIAQKTLIFKWIASTDIVSFFVNVVK